MPENIAIEEADGNLVILDLGGGRYALYAHLDPGSVRVHKGDAVKRGQVIGLVGNTGNSLAPHLHFHVMSRAMPRKKKERRGRQRRYRRRATRRTRCRWIRRSFRSGPERALEGFIRCA